MNNNRITFELNQFEDKVKQLALSLNNIVSQFDANVTLHKRTELEYIVVFSQRSFQLFSATVWYDRKRKIANYCEGELRQANYEKVIN